MTRDDVDRLDVPRKVGSGLASIGDSIDRAMQLLEVYIKRHG